MSSGANPNYQDSQGKTPFHIAVSRNNETMSRLFCESGADPDVRDGQLQNVWDCCPEDLLNKLNPVPSDDSKDVEAKADPDTNEDKKSVGGERYCVVCNSRPADRFLLPCRHKVICHQCASDFFEGQTFCPECNMAVVAAVEK